ncbi:MAG: phosphate/phosphite/phosphonate ABC transporter substrate-binding protein [Nitrospiria bacterium]
MKREHIAGVWTVFSLVLSFFLTPPAWAKPIRIGSIHDEPANEIRKFLPIARYLAKELESDGIDAGRVVVADSIPQMAALLRKGRVDLYIDSPFPSLAVSRFSGSKLLLRRWKKGMSEYHTVFFVRKDSGISRLEQLKGRMLAFEVPFSTSGYFLPKMVLIQKGFKLVLKRDASEPVAPDEVGYVFSRDDENTVVWVLRGKVSAGALDHRNYLKDAKGSLSQLKRLHETFSIPRHIVSYRADLPPRLVARIKDILLGMERSEEGRRVLKAFEKTTKFDEIPEQSLAPLLESPDFFDQEFELK